MTTCAAATISPPVQTSACCTRTTASACWPAQKPRPGSSAASTGKTSCTPKATGTSAASSAYSPNSPGKTTSTGTKAHGKPAFTPTSEPQGSHRRPAGHHRTAANRLQQCVLLPGQRHLYHPGSPQPGL